MGAGSSTSLPLKSGCCLCLTFTASAAAFSDSDSEFRPIIAVAAAEFASAAHKLAAAARSPVAAAVNPAAAAINYIRCCVGMEERAREDGRTRISPRRRRRRPPPPRPLVGLKLMSRSQSVGRGRSLLSAEKLGRRRARSDASDAQCGSRPFEIKTIISRREALESFVNVMKSGAMSSLQRDLRNTRPHVSRGWASIAYFSTSHLPCFSARPHY